MAKRDDRERERKANFARRRRLDLCNIGPPPKQKKKFAELKKRCEKDLVLWHTEVFKHTTGLKPFGDCQLDSINVSKQCLRRGGRILKLEPRSYGKSTRAVQEAMHAILYGHRNYAAIFGSSKDKTEELMDGIKLELEENETLFEIFPEVCHPFRALEGRGQRALTQHIDGVPTNISWRGDRIVFPTYGKSKSGGSMIAVKPIRNARGLQRRAGKSKGVLRPDLYLLDDIQTDEDAASRNRVRTILKTIRKSILRSAAMSSTAAVMMLATMIEADDVPDQLTRDPSWVTVRYQMLTSRAKHESMWLEEYAELRRSYIPGNIESQFAAYKKALAFYKRHRKKMDAGAKVSWDWAYPWRDPDRLTISAIQHAYNILIDDGEEVFACECQNDPIRINTSPESVKATREQCSASVVPIPRGKVPVEATHVVSFIDLHKNLFYWVGLSVDPKTNSRHVFDYRTWPEQPNRYFTLSNAKRTIPDLYPKLTMKAAVEAALKDCIADLVAMRFTTLAGARVAFDDIFFDANWGPTEKNVKKVARENAAASMLTPCHGKGLTAKEAAIEYWKPHPGEEKGDGWTRRRQAAKAVRTLVFDANHWKTETHLAIASPNESAGTLTIFDGSDRDHELFFDHLLSEVERKVTARRTVHEWNLPKVGGGENHFFDCLVGGIVGSDVSSGGKRPTTKSKTSFKFG